MHIKNLSQKSPVNNVPDFNKFTGVIKWQVATSHPLKAQEKTISSRQKIHGE